MIGFIYIGNEKIGEANFSVKDESMGVIGGDLFPNGNYKKYKPSIQMQFEQRGISNMEIFNYRIVLKDNTELKPSLGIGIIDCPLFQNSGLNSGFYFYLLSDKSYKNPSGCKYWLHKRSAQFEKHWM